MFKECICYECDKKCVLTITKVEDTLEVEGNECLTGMAYAEHEVENKKAILTTLVRIKSSVYNVVPVKSSKPIDKNLWIECSKALSRIYVGAPVRIGDVVCKNILNTGVDIVITKNINKED